MELERLAYDAALRSLDRQEQLLNELRARTGIYEALYAWKDQPAEVYRRLAYHLDRRWESNDLRLKSVVSAFRVAAATLAAEVALLVASVGATLV